MKILKDAVIFEWYRESCGGETIICNSKEEAIKAYDDFIFSVRFDLKSFNAKTGDYAYAGIADVYFDDDNDPDYFHTDGYTKLFRDLHGNFNVVVVTEISKYDNGLSYTETYNTEEGLYKEFGFRDVPEGFEELPDGNLRVCYKVYEKDDFPEGEPFEEHDFWANEAE